MPTPAHNFIAFGDYDIHVAEWGQKGRPALVMWHGLTRTGRDFDELASHFADDGWFVLCPDTLGRGLSSWSNNPAAEYNVAFYARVAVALLDAYQIARAGWLGTSMGGLIGMTLAASEHADRLKWLIMNDIAPEITQAAFDRIVSYAADPPNFVNVNDAERFLRAVHAPFGPAGDEFWRRMTRSSLRRRDDGRLTLHYDPRIIATMRADKRRSAWDLWRKISLPVHVTGGVQSDVLIRPIAARMATEGPKPQFTWWDDCGHAPSLSRAEDFVAVKNIVARLQSK